MGSVSVAWNGSSVSSSAFAGRRRFDKSASRGTGADAAFLPAIVHKSVGPMRSNSRSRGVVRMPVCQNRQNDIFQQLPFMSNWSPTDKSEYSIMGRYLLVIGLDYQCGHPKALVNLAMSYSRMARTVSELSIFLPHVGEVAVISTCNRFEIYAIGLFPPYALHELSAWMAKKSEIPANEFHKCCYWYLGHDAARHLFEVTAGFRPLIPDGKNLEHVRKISNCLEGFEGFGRIMKTLFEHAISVGELVRSELKLTADSVSFGSVAVDLALMKFPSTGVFKVLVIGAGKMGALVIKHLVVKGYKTITVVDIIEGRVSAICDEVKGANLIYKPREQMVSCIFEADIVFTCAACDDPFILKEDVGELNPLSSNLGGLKLFVDTSMPHNVDDSVSDLPFTRVLNINDIGEMLQNEMKGGGKALQAEASIDKQIDKFEAWLNSVGAVHILHSLRLVFYRDFGLTLEKRPHVGLSEDRWMRCVDIKSKAWADFFIYALTKNFKSILGNEFSKLVDDNGYPRFDDEECSRGYWF